MTHFLLVFENAIKQTHSIALHYHSAALTPNMSHNITLRVPLSEVPFGNISCLAKSSAIQDQDSGSGNDW